MCGGLRRRTGCAGLRRDRGESQVAGHAEGWHLHAVASAIGHLRPGSRSDVSVARRQRRRRSGGSGSAPRKGPETGWTALRHRRHPPRLEERGQEKRERAAARVGPLVPLAILRGALHDPQPAAVDPRHREGGRHRRRARRPDRELRLERARADLRADDGAGEEGPDPHRSRHVRSDRRSRSRPAQAGTWSERDPQRQAARQYPEGEGADRRRDRKAVDGPCRRAGLQDAARTPARAWCRSPGRPRAE